MIRRFWSEQVRITCWALLATLGAAVMLAPLVEKLTYLWHGAVGGLLIVLVGAVLRARRAPRALTILAQLVILVELCLVVYAQRQLAFHVLPTRGAFVALAHRFAEFKDLTNRYAAPVPDNPDLTMALAIFVLALALVVDAVAVTWRRVPLTGLLFLGIYMVPVALLGGAVSMFVFIPAAAGFVFLLAADERERLTHWGRQISAAGSVWEDPAEEVYQGGIRSTGRRIGLGAVAAAVVVPIIVPTLSPHYFGHSSTGGGAGSGDGPTRVTNPVLDLKRNLTSQSDAVMMTFSTDQPDPGYFRLASLDEFTGTVWQPGTRPSAEAVTSTGPLPLVPGLTSTVPRSIYHYDVQVTDSLQSTWLPLVYAPTVISSAQRWNVDQATLDAIATADGQTTSGVRYSFTSSVPRPTARLLRSAGRLPAGVAALTALPSGLPPVIAERAREVTAGATNAFDQAEALQSWFRTRGGFRYSLQAAPGNGLSTIEAFLTTDRVGYCEQFASAMALMARSLGIPARVVVGFLHAEQVGGRYVYRGTDMHSWPELYFAGVGWVRFEPTPAVRTGSAPSYGAGSQVGGSPSSSPSPDRKNAALEQLNGVTASPAPGGAGGGRSTPWTGGLGLAGGAGLLLLLAAAPRLLRSQVSRRRWGRARSRAATAEAAWAELRDTVLDLRLQWDAGATPRGMGRQLRSLLPPSTDVVRGLNRIVLAVEQARYARGVRDGEALAEDVATLTAALASTRSARSRWVARWMPASLLHARWVSRHPTTKRQAAADGLVTVAE